MKLMKSLLVSMAAAGLLVGQTASASATRSTDSIPSLGLKVAPASAVSRGSKPAEDANELFSAGALLLLFLLAGGLAIALASGGSSNDSPG